MTTLDATEFKETGKDLITKIAKEVKATQSTVIRELPNELLITQSQFDDLMRQKEGRSYISAIDNPFHNHIIGKVQKAHIFYTPHNVMDVKVKK